MLSDLVTPVGIYLQLRDRFPHSLLLEAADSRGAENSFSFICFDELAQFEVRNFEANITIPGRSPERRSIKTQQQLVQEFDSFKSHFVVKKSGDHPDVSGFYGFSSYDSVELYEDITLQNSHQLSSELPQLSYRFYRYVIAINHFKSELFLIEHRGIALADTEADIRHKEIAQLILRQDAAQYPFALEGQETSTMTDEEHRQMIRDCKRHIFRGDIFQIVPSRRFSYSYSGDDFNVYRALRSINPSPYLFYFDFGSFRLFGSSPEAQLIIKDRKATVFPIAGTYRRTGNERSDLELAQKLAADPKENAEHVMLVDLARNDLSRHCTEVTVEAFKEAHFYSHVIHLVSKVSGMLGEDFNTLAVLGDTFPAGTLSGAPKYRAMQLIDTYERDRRGFYGGCLGYIGLNGDCNHCIIIRSFFSSNNQLVLRAGGGVVADSVEESEVAEVRNKLNALRVALERAQRGVHE
jgi:anthranilate synthase component I